MSKETVSDKKELAVKEQTALAEVPSDWGTAGSDAKDLVISKILLQQALSEYVIDGKAKPGDIVDSVSGKVLGDRNKPVEIIPLFMFKTWTEQEERGGKFEFVRTFPVTAENQDAPLEFSRDGKKYRWDLNRNFYVLLASEAKEADCFPMVVTFRRTSALAGKQIATHFTKMQMLKAAPAAKTLQLKCRQEKNDKGTFFVFEIGEGRKTDTPELIKAHQWFTTLKKSSFRVDDSDEAVSGSDHPVNTSGPVQF